MDDNNRPLFIDFDQYTDGDDDFKKELVKLMVDNIRELKEALETAEQDVQFFQRVSHKTKPTIEMLNDKAFEDLIAQVKTAEDMRPAIAELRVICAQIMKSLERIVA